jgi:hypothetical protein
VVWLGNNLSFALLYWLTDSGGSPREPSPPPRRERETEHPAPAHGPVFSRSRPALPEEAQLVLQEPLVRLELGYVGVHPAPSDRLHDPRPRYAWGR